MQGAAMCLTGPFPIKSSNSFARTTSTKLQRTLLYPKAATVNELSTTDFSSSTSVFPVEACETIGGEACNVEMYPEAKLEAPINRDLTRAVSEKVEREYFKYNQTKTVFLGEARDDLGGEFCDAEYQTGVYKERASAN